MGVTTDNIVFEDYVDSDTYDHTEIELVETD